ncbi:unnamed protein product [Calypogeia fissa]
MITIGLHAWWSQARPAQARAGQAMPGHEALQALDLRRSRSIDEDGDGAMEVGDSEDEEEVVVCNYATQSAIRQLYSAVSLSYYRPASIISRHWIHGKWDGQHFP